MDWVRHGAKVKNKATGRTGILKRMGGELWEIELDDGTHPMAYIDQIEHYYEPVIQSDEL